MNCLALCVLLALGVAGLSHSAPLWPPQEVERLVEELVENGESEGSVEMLLDELSQIGQRPINLRTLTEAQMRGLPLIAPGEARRIAQFLRANPDVRAVGAIAIALRMPPARRQLFVLFYTLEDGAPRFDSASRRRLRGDLVQRFGYRVPLFSADPVRMKRVYGNAQGSPLALLLRASLSSDNGFACGFKGMKSPGEPFFHAASPQGFPYYSAYMQLQGKLFSSPRVILGDFTARFGTGQTVGSSAPLIGPQAPYAWGKLGAGIRARLGCCDNSTLRGVAWQHQPLAWLSYAVALSAQPLSAMLADSNSSPEQGGRIVSILPRPTYTNLREAKRHFNVWEFCAIASMQASVGPISLCYTAIATSYNRDFLRVGPGDFRLPNPARTAMRNGLSAHLFLSEWALWGEVTLSSPLRDPQRRHAVSGCVGASFSPSYNLSIGAQGYFYPPDATSRYALGVASVPQNRMGAIVSIMARVADSVVLMAGAECMGFINPNVPRTLPPFSWRGSVEAQYALPQGGFLDVRYRYREFQNARGAKSYRDAPFVRSHGVRLRGEFRMDPWLSLRSSLLYAYCDGALKARGRHNWAVAQDIRLQLLGRRIVLTCRGALYSCLGDGVPMALYEYTPRYSMAIARLSKSGWRVYGIAYWECFRGLSVTCKAALSQLWGESKAALTALGRLRRDMLELTLQFQWKF